jgi:glyoxylase-like metal-dependent hydrolase (beta-lactamase superfamily II)
MALQTWTPLTADGSVLALKYSFGVGTANTMAVRLQDGSWLVVSPSTKSPPAVLDDLAAKGPVSALLAPNGFHHMGQQAWRARFPEAVSYAPAGALPRLRKQAPDVPFHPADELSAKLPSTAAILQPDGMKAPDLLVRATTADGTVWFSGDLLSNTGPEDMGPVPRFILGLLGGGSGYRFNRMPTIVYVKDRSAWFASVLRAFEQAPPTVILPAHGDPVRDDAMAKSRAILS